MTWNYRIVRSTEGEAEYCAIYEVYYDDEGRPEARTERPAHPAGETLEDFADDLQAYQAALSQPVLDDAVFRQATGGLFKADEP
jgi:hypothetical protein